MATSPYFSTSNPYILYDIHVDLLSQDIANNTSTVKVWVIAWRTNQGYQTYGSGYCIVDINGEEYYDEIEPSQVISYESDTLMFERTVTIPHDADGKKTIYVSAYFDHERFSSSSQGFNVTLTAIPRQATLLTAPNINDTDNPTITYSNPAGLAVTSLQACISSDNSTAVVAYRDINKMGSSYKFNLTQSERNTLLNFMATFNTRTFYYIVKTVIAGNTYYSSKPFTFTVANALPTISGITYRDTNATTTAITQNDQKIIQNNSTVTFTFSALAALKNAFLANIRVTIDGVTKVIGLGGQSQSNVSLAFGVVNSSSNVTATVTLTDSRGNKSTQELTVTMLEWSLPTATISLARKSNYYDDTYITVNANYSSLDNNNTVTIQYQYKETGAGSYGSLVTIQNGVTATISLDNTKSYDFRFVITDRLGTTTYNKALQIGIPIFYVDRMLRSVGIGTLPNEQNMLAVDRRLQIKNTMQEIVADIWATALDGNYRSCFLRFYEQNGIRLVDLGASKTYGNGFLYLRNASDKHSVILDVDTTNGNGFVRVNDSNGNRLGQIGRSSTGGGILNICDPNGDAKAQLYENAGGRLWLANSGGNTVLYGYAGTYGGVFGVYNSAGTRVMYMDILSSGGGRLISLDSNNTATITLNGTTGDVNCVSVTQTSSRKLKENIKPLSITEAKKVLGLIAVTFDFIDKTKGVDKRGFIAEDVEEIIPELVTPEREDEPARLDYIGIIPYLQTVIKNQEIRIQELEQRLTALEQKLENN